MLLVGVIKYFQIPPHSNLYPLRSNESIYRIIFACYCLLEYMQTQGLREIMTNNIKLADSCNHRSCLFV